MNSKVVSLESTNNSLNKKVKDQGDEIELLTASRDKLKKDNDELHSKLIQMEDELFVSKNMQLKYLEKMKEFE